MNRPTGSTWFIWHDMTWIHSCCQFWMDGVEIILYSSSWVPDNVNVCLQCRLNDTSTSETCHFELSKKHHWASNLNLTVSWLTKPVAYWRIIPRTGKSSHVQATGKVNRDRLVAHLIHLTWHDMNSFMLSVLNGRSWNNIVLQQLGPGQCKCLSAMPLEWYINLRNLSFWTVKKTPLGQQFDSVMAPLNLWLTGESFHAPGNHLTCKPQAK